MEDFHIVTAADIPGENTIALIEKDQVCLVDKLVNHPEEAVVLLAHPDRELCEKRDGWSSCTLRSCRRCLIMDESLEGDVRVWATTTSLKQFSIDKGDVARALAGSPDHHRGVNTRLARKSSSTSSRRGWWRWRRPSMALRCGARSSVPYYVHSAGDAVWGWPKNGFGSSSARRRRFRRQGRIPVDAGGPCGAFGVEGGVRSR